jgi:hypothetical protein
MTDSTLRNVLPTLVEQENYLSQILDNGDFQKLIVLKDELRDTWIKKQVFRTETEMRVSVLNDTKFPTNASKYWQCVREQNVFFESLMTLSFQSRRNNVEIKKIQKALQSVTDECELELLQIELEEKLYSRANMELIAKHRVREIEQWSMLKKELDDGTFDVNDVNTHQIESLTKQLENRALTLSANSAPAEIANVIGPLATAKRLQTHMHQALPNNTLTVADTGQLTLK